VLSGAGDPARAATAMASARRHLWRRDDGLLLLLTPPFDREPPDPGYIRAYPPGVRENGGQYTHGAVWGAWAMADQGDGDAAVELLRSLSGVTRAATAEAAERYRVEPYVVAADVYGAEPFVGRGGWTWYTGAAGWLYRFGIERVLGLRLRGDRLEIDPCIAADWPGFTVELRHGGATYEVVVENPDGVCGGVVALALDGEPVAARCEARPPACRCATTDPPTHRTSRCELADVAGRLVVEQPGSRVAAWCADVVLNHEVLEDILERPASDQVHSDGDLATHRCQEDDAPDRDVLPGEQGRGLRGVLDVGGPVAVVVRVVGQLARLVAVGGPSCLAGELSLIRDVLDREGEGLSLTRLTAEAHRERVGATTPRPRPPA
jgi:hypothetical protein